MEAKTDVAPVIEVAVTGGSGALRSRVADRVVLPELARAEGAAKIDVVGATPLRLTVRPRSADLAARGLTAADVEERLRLVGRTVTAGRVREGALVRPVVVAEPVRGASDLQRVTIGGVPLGEVADTALREVPDDTFFRLLQVDGGGARSADGVLLRVYRAPRANAVALAGAVRDRVSDLRGRLRDVRIDVVVDRSGDVSRALAELALGALLGILAGTVILRWMIGHWSATLALAVVIPAALLASFSGFYAAGVPLDIISLSGLALAAGLLVDNSIVVLESIETARDVAAGTRQIVTAVVASSITLVIVFAPLLYLRGLARALFGEQAVAVVVSVAASLVLSLTLTPVLAQMAASRGPAAGGRRPGQRLYEAWLERVMERPKAAFAAGAAIVALGITAGAFLPRELFARGAERDVIVEAHLARDVDPLVARERLSALWRDALASVDRPSIAAMWLTRDGGDGPATMHLRFRSARDARAAVARLGALAADVPLTARIRPSAFVEAVAGDADRVELIASAATEREADALGSRVVDVMRRHGFTLAGDRRREASTAIGVRFDDRLLAVNHVERPAVEQQIRAALGQADVGQADIAAAEPSIRMLPSVPEDVALAPVRVGNAIVPVSAVAGVQLASRAAAAFHDERRPAQRLSFLAAANADAAIAAIAPRGTERVRVAGHAAELRDAFAQMRLALLLAAVLLYLTVAAFYESLLLPLPVMAALPFAASGALAALALTGQTLNVMSLMGLIFIAGVVVNHTVVLLDRAEQLRARGVAEDAAIREAAADRYRPVMMTTLTALAGMLPLALFGGPGVELRRSIAIVVIGGLTTATPGTLLLIPLLHRALEPFRKRHA